MSTTTTRGSVRVAATLLIGILSACDSPSLATSEQVISPRNEAPTYAAAMRADIARLRASNTAGPASVGTTWGTHVTAADIAYQLERLLMQPAGPRASFESFFLNGGSSISVNGAPPASRNVEFGAWTHCSGCSSASTETGGEMSMTLVQSGGLRSATSRFGNPSPYSSGWYIMGISGVRADASIYTVHTARYVNTSYTKRSSAGATV